MNPSPPSSLATAVVIRRSLFFMVLIALTLGNLFTLFQGLNTPQAMDQAQIAREIARGNGFTTKFIRPVAYAQVSEEKDITVPFTKFQDTYHSPLNPLINAAILKLVGADDPEQWKMGKNEQIYPLDRVIATVCTVFFLISIGVTYLLVSRIFDTRIAAVTALLMLFCETLWQYSLSGLPQMLMLMLFSCALYFAYRASEAASEGKIAMTPAVISGVFFSLLALTHWMAVWMALGYLIYAAIVYRPRGVVALFIFGMILVPGAFVMFRNSEITGSVFGTAYLTLHNGLAGSEDDVMRAATLQHEIPLNGLISKILRYTLLQGTQIIPLLAGIVIAPLFFLSLLHPFKRKSIASFRWAILLMWVTTALGLSFFGITTEKIDPNQLHLLFAPIMTAYGLAFISILWNRLDFVTTTSSLRNAHYIGVVSLCSLPLLLSLPQKIRLGMTYRDGTGLYPNFPPYNANAFNRTLKTVIPERQMVYSDQPWAVAWYADRISMWLPSELKTFEEIESASVTLDARAAGIVITPASYGSYDMLKIHSKYKEFSSLVIDGQALIHSAGRAPLFELDAKMAPVFKRFPVRVPLLKWYMLLYSERAISTEPEGES